MSALVPYDGSAAALVVDWCAASPFSREWVPDGDPAADLAPDAVLARWHEDPDISGYLLVRDGEPVAYGELWVDRDEDEAELAHLVVDPARRRQGLGRALALALVEQAGVLGLGTVTLRVHPDNAVGIACYLSAGFVRYPAAEEASFNAGQPTAYQWMHIG